MAYHPEASCAREGGYGAGAVTLLPIALASNRRRRARNTAHKTPTPIAPGSSEPQWQPPPPPPEPTAGGPASMAPPSGVCRVEPASMGPWYYHHPRVGGGEQRLDLLQGPGARSLDRGAGVQLPHLGEGEDRLKRLAEVSALGQGEAVHLIVAAQVEVSPVLSQAAEVGTGLLDEDRGRGWADPHLPLLVLTTRVPSPRAMKELMVSFSVNTTEMAIPASVAMASSSPLGGLPSILT